MEGLLATYGDELVTLSRVALAMVLGALIGLDREAARKPAGLRTQMLVAGAAALFVRLGDLLIARVDPTLPQSLVNSDPIRVIQSVVIGVSFIGAGTIIRDRERHSVEGLTTAASLLLCAGVGIAVGLSLFVTAAGVTLLVLVILACRSWFGRPSHKETD